MPTTRTERDTIRRQDWLDFLDVMAGAIDEQGYIDFDYIYDYEANPLVRAFIRRFG